MQGSRKTRRFAWLLVAATFGAGALWVLVPSGGRDQRSKQPLSKTEPTAAPTTGADLSRLKQAMAVLAQSHADPGSADRRVALGDLLAEGDLSTKLTLVLEAAAADPTPADKDPLWPDLVRGLSNLWRGETLTWGMDQMFTESRPRARHALISSFAYLATSERANELSAPQRQALTDHFIDLYNQLPSGLRPEVVAALRKVGGNDVADVMAGKGLYTDNELEATREYKRNMEEGKRMLAQQAPADPPPAQPAEPSAAAPP